VRIYTDARCLQHAVPAGFPERRERLAALLAAFARDAGLVVDGEAAGAVGDARAEAAARRVHEPSYVDRLRRAIERGDGLIDTSDNPISSGSWDAALAAVATTLAALESVLGGGEPRAFAAVRPPGHHAERDRAMGFCLLNNVAIAAEEAVTGHGLERVAIVDVDVHHGNGTQHLFEDRGDVLYASLHQWPFYPGTGAADERGTGAGEGATVNVPLPAGSGDGEYRAALDGVVLPALARFRPELVVVSAGFDAWREDPLGGMRVSERGFAEWGARLRAAADEHASGRLLMVLEGGYDVTALPGLVRAFLIG
jgi:acetoin utilization deacetylase AcuC-like enzyme